MPRMSALCVFACVVSWVLGHNAAAAEIQVTVAQAKSLGIETAPLSTQKHPAFGFPAQVVIPAGQLQVVSAPLSGLVTETLAAPNQAVRKGQPLLRLQSPALVQGMADDKMQPLCFWISEINRVLPHLCLCCHAG